jgi:ParB family chromosome partitioning protein
MSPIVNVPMNAVIVPVDRRECDPEAVSQLADSMSAIGLKTPITVRVVKRDVDTDGSDAIADHFLVAGAHRLEAARSLGWSEIDASPSERAAHRVDSRRSRNRTKARASRQ